MIKIIEKNKYYVSIRYNILVLACVIGNGFFRNGIYPQVNLSSREGRVNLSGQNILWAKRSPEKTLLFHSIDAACCTQVLLSEGCMRPLCTYLSLQCKQTEQQILSLCGYLTSLHDIGKAHPFFQVKAPELLCVQTMKNQGLFRNVVLKKRFRHERYTKTIVQRIWRAQATFDEIWAENFSTVLSLHHQGKSGEGFRIADNQNPKWWEEQQLELEQTLKTLFCEEEWSMMQCGHLDGVCTTLTGLVILADWIASGSHFDALDAKSVSAYQELSYKQALLAIQNYGLQHQPFLSYKKSFSELWPFLTQDSLRPIQIQCQNEQSNPAEFYLIEAPMGEGKTESALYLSALLCQQYNKSGLYFALPTMATSNQMFRRVNELFHEQNVGSAKLLHAKAFLLDEIKANIQSEDERETAGAWLEPLRRGLLSANAVGTIDQAMMAVLCAKYTVLRLLGLENKVLILDEIHAYDTYMSEIIDRLLAWCSALEIPVVMLSATLPSARKKELLFAYGASTKEVISDYPLITAVHGDGCVRQIPSHNTYMSLCFQFHFLKDHELEYAVREQWANVGGVFCVLVNTVKKARDVFLNLQVLEIPKEELLLFHARFPAKARNGLEERCISLCGKNGNRPKRLVVIGTQVLEQSLDVDFDAMFTELAPIDLLLQRAGRVFRHRDTTRPPKCTAPHIHVVCKSESDFGVAEVIYEKLLLQRTRDMIQAQPTLCIPKDMRRAIEEVYREELLPSELEIGAKKVFKEQLAQNHAKGVVLPLPEADSFFATQRGTPYDIFTQDDEDKGLLGMAKTRLSEESVALALLREDLFEKAVVNAVPLNIARLVMSEMVSVRKKEVATFLPKAIEAQGRLRGCYLFKADEDGCIRDEKNRVLRVDKDLGLISEEG